MKKLLSTIFSLLFVALVGTAQNQKSELKLFRFGDVSNEKPGVILPDGRRLNVSSFGEDYTQNFFATKGIARLTQWLAKNAGKCPGVPATARIAPCVANPSKIVAIGLNYAKHVQESGAAIAPLSVHLERRDRLRRR